MVHNWAKKLPQKLLDRKLVFFPIQIGSQSSKCHKMAPLAFFWVNSCRLQKGLELSLLFFNGRSLCWYKTVPHITMPWISWCYDDTVNSPCSERQGHKCDSHCMNSSTSHILSPTAHNNYDSRSWSYPAPPAALHGRSWDLRYMLPVGVRLNISWHASASGYQ